MARFVLVDCNIDDRDWTAGYLAHLPAATRVVRASEGLPDSLDGHDGVVLTGSAASVVEPEPWQDDLEALLRDTVRVGTPVLGICFGHQVLARAVFGAEAVGRRASAEVGWLPVTHTPHPLLDGFDAPFRPFVTHLDEVRPAPGMSVFARSEACAVHGFEVAGARAWGVQFHVEMLPEQEEMVVYKRAGLHPELGIDPDAMLAARVPGHPMAARLFANFRSLVGA